MRVRIATDANGQLKHKDYSILGLRVQGSATVEVQPGLEELAAAAIRKGALVVAEVEDTAEAAVEQVEETVATAEAAVEETVDEVVDSTSSVEAVIEGSADAGIEF